MDELDRTLHDAGAEARAAVAASIDVEADLAATLQRRITHVDEPGRRGPANSALVVVSAAAALVVLLVGVLVVVGGESADDVEPTGTFESLPGPTPAPETTLEQAAPTSEPLPQDGSPALSTPGPTPVPTATATSVAVTATLPPQPVVVPVSHLDPPATYQPDAFASIDAGTAIGDGAEFAVGDGIIVITSDEAAVTIVDVATGSATTRTLAVQVGNPVLGPDNVLYGLSFTPSTDPNQAMPDAAIVAQSLDTDPVTVVGSVAVSTNTYVEIPRGTFVAGPDGIYDVERAPGKVMDFVDGGATGTATPTVAYTDDADRTIRTSDGSAEWVVPLVADPDAAAPFLGPTPPAPGPDGAVRIVRHIGPRLETEPVDFGTPTKQVVADLTAGGGRWWSIPDDWDAVASSSDGTLLVRRAGSDLDLAWFEPDPPPALPFSPTTVLARSGNDLVAIHRDSIGHDTRSTASPQIGWANGCTLDDIEALFAAAPAGSVLERLACDRRLAAGPTDSTIIAGTFTTDGARSGIQLFDDPTTGPTTDFDDATAVRFANMPTTPIVGDGAVPTGDTFPAATPFSDTSTPTATRLFTIAAGAATPADFGDEIVNVFDAESPSTTSTSTVFDTATAHLVVVTRPGDAEGTAETVHYYWLSARDDTGRLSVDRALQTARCATGSDGVSCS